MDGFALRSADADAPRRILGTLYAGTAGQNSLYHGGGNLLGIGADALSYYPVVPGHYQHGFGVCRRLQGPADSAEPLGDVMQSSQGSGWHYQLRGSLPGPVDPIGINRRYCIYNVG